MLSRLEIRFAGRLRRFAMTIATIPREVIRKVRKRRHERADREQAEGAARYERAITGGMSREQRAELYRRLAADLPRERPARVTR